MLEYSLRKSDALFLFFHFFFSRFLGEGSQARSERGSRDKCVGEKRIYGFLFIGASLSHALIGFLVEYPRLLHIGVPITRATGLGKQVGSEIGKVGKLINKH